MIGLEPLLQTVDDYISDWFVKKTIALLTQYIFFGLLAYWTASVISRISDKSICSGIIVAIALMGVILFVRLLKYHVFYEETATRYLWYSYYIPQCIAPVVLLLTILGIALDNARESIPENWRSRECEKLGASVRLQIQDETLYATLSFGEREAIV